MRTIFYGFLWFLLILFVLGIALSLYVLENYTKYWLFSKLF